MTKKPKGKKYRNLVARGGVIYYEKVFDGERVRFSCQTDDWAKAAAVRDLYEQRRQEGPKVEPTECPTLAEFAERYLREDTDHLAWTTRRDRESHLNPAGPMVKRLGTRLLTEIDSACLREWWTAEIQRGGRSPKTGFEYLTTLSAVFSYARDPASWNRTRCATAGRCCDDACGRSREGQRPTRPATFGPSRAWTTCDAWYPQRRTRGERPTSLRFWPWMRGSGWVRSWRFVGAESGGVRTARTRGARSRLRNPARGAGPGPH